jgi:hypothetical protein
MARVKYVGPFDAVDVAGVGTVKRGESVDVPAVMAKSLCEQGEAWKRVGRIELVGEEGPEILPPNRSAEKNTTED